jgi:hypothetical protein
LGQAPHLNIISKSKKGQQWELAVLLFESRKEQIEIKVEKEKEFGWLNYYHNYPYKKRKTGHWPT